MQPDRHFPGAFAFFAVFCGLIGGHGLPDKRAAEVHGRIGRYGRLGKQGPHGKRPRRRHVQTGIRLRRIQHDSRHRGFQHQPGRIQRSGQRGLKIRRSQRQPGLSLTRQRGDKPHQRIGIAQQNGQIAADLRIIEKEPVPGNQPARHLRHQLGHGKPRTRQRQQQPQRALFLGILRPLRLVSAISGSARDGKPQIQPHRRVGPLFGLRSLHAVRQPASLVAEAQGAGEGQQRLSRPLSLLSLWAVQRGLQLTPEIRQRTGAFQRRLNGDTRHGLPEPEPLDAQFSDRRQLQIPRNVRSQRLQEGGPQQIQGIGRRRRGIGGRELRHTQHTGIEDTQFLHQQMPSQQRTGTDAQRGFGHVQPNALPVRKPHFPQMQRKRQRAFQRADLSFNTHIFQNGNSRIRDPALSGLGAQKRHAPGKGKKQDKDKPEQAPAKDAPGAPKGGRYGHQNACPMLR